jgi:hypothetical protein
MLWFIGLVILQACQNNPDPQQTPQDILTGNQVSYELFPGSEFQHSGLITFHEMKSGYTMISIDLDGPEVNATYPVHLHYGPFADDADIAALLISVDSRTGVSEPELSELANFTQITYKDLLEFDGHIKIHFDDQLNQDVILAYASIGVNPNQRINGRVATCKSSFKE